MKRFKTASELPIFTFPAARRVSAAFNFTSPPLFKAFFTRAVTMPSPRPHS